MRVLYFHQHFSTPQGSTGTRSYEMARKLVLAGHQVTMVCGSYHGGQTGLNSIFHRGRREGQVDGIDVIEFDISYSNSTPLIKRAFIFGLFAFRSVIVAMTRQYDVVFATTTPLTAGIPGIFARWLRRKTFVFEVRDLWPELPRAMGVIRNPLLLSLMSLLEWCSYHSAHRLIALAPGMVEGISRRGVSLDRIIMIPNGCDFDIFAASTPAWRPAGVYEDDFLAIFTGTHGVANGLDAVLDAAELLKSIGREDIKFALVGDGKLKPGLQQRASREHLNNVIFHSPVGKSKLAGLMAGADVGLQILANVPAFYFGTSPNKFFDYISAGLPVVSNYPGWLASILKESGAGVSVAPDDPHALAEALINMADNRQKLSRMSREATILARERFDRDVLSNRFVTWLEESYEENDFGRPLKKVFDRLVSGLALLILLPLIIVLAGLVRWKLGSPVFFTQLRPGLRGRPFRMMKFRTMTNERTPNGDLLPDSQRLSSFGRFLRSTSLDELPELLNVLRGDMSLVGPRPLLMEYLPLYSKHQARRHEARPGITGWAQINGRNALSWEEKFELDVWYVDNQSLWLDIKILLKTVWQVIQRDGISHGEDATMPRFKGSNRDD